MAVTDHTSLADPLVIGGRRPVGQRLAAQRGGGQLAGQAGQQDPVAVVSGGVDQPVVRADRRQVVGRRWP